MCINTQIILASLIRFNLNICLREVYFWKKNHHLIWQINPLELVGNIHSVGRSHSTKFKNLNVNESYYFSF